MERNIVFTHRPTTPAEDKYTYRNSEQIAGQCGFIGHLRADMDTDGNGFFSSWYNGRKYLKTDAFKDEFDDLINTLREKDNTLHNRKALAHYCYTTPQARMNTTADYYGMRVDTEKYTYLFRLNPNKGEYNVYCYCYKRDWLDQHLHNASRGIRFITPNYDTLFRIADGEKIKITHTDGATAEKECRYIDDYHLEIDDNIYHICEYAERIEQNGYKVEPANHE